jgi:hypothetical protein
VERDDIGLEALLEPTVGRLLPLNIVPKSTRAHCSAEEGAIQGFDWH